MFNGLDVSKVTQLYPYAATWDLVKRLRDAVTVKLLIKGIVTHEDAQLAVEHGVDGLVVSNHGGRAEETLRSTIESLPEVIEGVAGKIPVIVDGGLRRGTDIFKALALGATAVGLGGRIPGDLRRLGLRASRRFWRFTGGNCAPSCGKRARLRSTRSRATTLLAVRPNGDSNSYDAHNCNARRCQDKRKPVSTQQAEETRSE
jgi:hypothetical protein